MSHEAWIVIVAALVTAALRFVPFLIFDGRKTTPAYVLYLGKVLPYAIMGMLVVYCLRGINFTKSPFGAAECIACAVVVGVHLWKRNTLISIVGGTVCYMLLVQCVF